MAQPSRLAVARSSAFRNLVDGEDEDEVREGFTEEVRAHLPLALAGVRAEVAVPESKRQRAMLLAELTEYLRIGGANMTDAQKDDWFDGCMKELSEYPLSLLIDSVARARKRIKGPWEMVWWVVADIEPAVDRLRLEEERLAKLAEIAGA